MATSGKKKCRQYSVDYLRYGFIPSPSNCQLPMCLICEHVFSNEAMKPSRLKEHFSIKHPDHSKKDIAFFENLQAKIMKRNTLSDMFKKGNTKSKDGMLASYNISKLIAKDGKPHSIGETLILPAISEVISTVMNQNAAEILRSIPLSNDTVARRIDEMASDVEIQLIHILQTTEFSLQLDESTLCDNEALLLAYVRFTKEGATSEELLFAKSLVTDTRGESIFEVVQSFFEHHNIPLSNIIACSTDGAPSMIGCYRGFIALLKKAVPSVFSIHCVIHRQHLVAKKLSDQLNSSLQVVITAINCIKTRALKDRLFRQLCHENDEHFERLLLHTEVRWLSKGNCLKRFNELFDTIVQFLDGFNPKLSGEIKIRKHDIAYLSDIFDKLNWLNLQLQGQDVNLIKTKSVVVSFMSKLALYKQNICRGEFYQFPSLQTVPNITVEQLRAYASHLESMNQDMQFRFKDLTQLIVPGWVMNPFNTDLQMVELEIQEQLAELQADIEARIEFDQLGYSSFWMQTKNILRMPLLCQRTKLLILAFPTSYLVEKGFSAVMRLHTKQRNRLQITKSGDLRLMLTKFEPDVAKLANEHQCQGSH